MPARTFADLGVPAALVAQVERGGITTPFPIQTATLPDSLSGRDVLGRGRTGSGKTLAFSLPLVARLSGGRRSRPTLPRAIVLAPTRELANQITATLEPLATSVGLTVTTIFGGVSKAPQVRALNAGVDIVVACPGRLEDLMRERRVRLDDVEISVLDEADHMADLGFLPGVTRILAATPTTGQRMLFSATLDAGVDVLVKRFLHQPVTHSVDSAESPVATLTHHLFEVSDAAAKREIVTRLASGTGRRLLFMRTKHQARKLARQLTEDGVPAADLHGNLSQNVRERNLAAFASGEVKVMVATDTAARGIHVDDIDLVVHVDPPAEHKAYLHRSGRTARAGHGGDVVTIVLPEQRGDVRQLTRAAKITAQLQRVTPTDPAVTALIGEVAAKVDPRHAPAGAAHKPDPADQSAHRSGKRGQARTGHAPTPSRGSGARQGAQGGRGQTGSGRSQAGAANARSAHATGGRGGAPATTSSGARTGSSTRSGSARPAVAASHGSRESGLVRMSRRGGR